jgi:hypothetical protein
MGIHQIHNPFINTQKKIRIKEARWNSEKIGSYRRDHF